MPTDGAKSILRQSATRGGSASAHVNEATLRYAAGTTGSPVLLVHGFPETWRAFRRLIPCSPPATRSSPWTWSASATPTPRQGDHDSKACPPRPSARTCGLAPQRGGGQQAEGAGSGDDLGPGVRAELGVQVGDVGL